MRALSVKEPWLTIIVEGKKTIETRTWAPRSITPYRDLLLVGSKKPKGRYSGKAACVVNVRDYCMMGKNDEEAACCEVYPGAWAWFLGNVRKVWPVPIKGQLGIYDVPDVMVMVKSDENSPQSYLDEEREWFFTYGLFDQDELKLDIIYDTLRGKS